MRMDVTSALAHAAVDREADPGPGGLPRERRIAGESHGGVGDGRLAGTRREGRLLGEAHGHLAASTTQAEGGRTNQTKKAWALEDHGCTAVEGVRRFRARRGREASLREVGNHCVGGADGACEHGEGGVAVSDQRRVASIRDV